jgi:hypothetical protein
VAGNSTVATALSSFPPAPVALATAFCTSGTRNVVLSRRRGRREGVRKEGREDEKGK